MRKPYYKPYPEEVNETLNKLLPRFYVRVASFKSPYIAYLKLANIGYISEGIYLVLPDAFAVLDDLFQFINEQITISDLKDRVKYTLRYNGIKAVLEPYCYKDVKIPKRAIHLIEKTLFGFNFDYPSQNVKETFRTHTGILQRLIMTIADFGFPGRLSSALFSYVHGKTTSEELLNEVDNIYLTFKGIKPGLKF
jgi:hypothetical protein